MFDALTLTLAAMTFFVAGITKGVIGMGLPTVSLIGLTLIIDLPAAMVLLLMPSLVTNIWQGLRGPFLRALCRELWPFFLAAVLLIWAGVRLGESFNTNGLTALLGGLLVSYGSSALLGKTLALPENRKGAVGFVAGVANGVFTGLTGSFVVPGVLYLQSLKLPRDALIQAMGLLFTLSTLVLGLALADHHKLPAQQLWISLLAVLPAAAGMYCGQAIRARLSEQQFRRVFYLSLIMLGGYLIITRLLS